MKYPSKLAIFGGVFALAVLLAGSATAVADAIPYPNAGTMITGPNTLYAIGANAPLYYYGFNAADTDYIDVLDVTSGTQSGWIFANQTTGKGTLLTLPTTANDVLVIEIWNLTTGSYFYSDGIKPTTTKNGGVFTCDALGGSNCTGADGTPADNSDHAYLTAYSGGDIPGTTVNPGAGIFVGMEDMDTAQGSDWDYNDDQFVLTGVSTGAPEPGSLILLGTGLIGIAGLMLRRRATA